MKKIIFVFVVSLFISSFSFANVSEYRINDNAVESLFAQAEEISIFNAADFKDMSPDLELMTNPGQLKGSTPIVAFVLCFFFGGIGIHRLYLGTDPVVVIAYCALSLCTGIGGAILWCGDSLVLLIGVIENNVDKYVENTALIMW